MASSSNINPYDNYESSRIEQDVIDPDDRELPLPLPPSTCAHREARITNLTLLDSRR